MRNRYDDMEVEAMPEEWPDEDRASQKAASRYVSPITLEDKDDDRHQTSD